MDTHAQHLRFGLSLMNRWAAEGGDPFADATWDEAWKTSDVDAPTWEAIRNGLRDEAHRWLMALESPRDVSDVELTGMIGSIPHLAYHLGAIRQITKHGRGPREGTYSQSTSSDCNPPSNQQLADRHIAVNVENGSERHS